MKNKTSEKITLLSGKLYLDFTQPSNEETVELNPCPFCGSGAKLVEDVECGGHGCFITRFFVKCTLCGSRGKIGSVYGITEKEAKTKAIDGWNRRN